MAFLDEIKRSLNTLQKAEEAIYNLVGYSARIDMHKKVIILYNHDCTLVILDIDKQHVTESYQGIEEDEILRIENLILNAPFDNIEWNVIDNLADALISMEVSDDD